MEVILSQIMVKVKSAGYTVISSKVKGKSGGYIITSRVKVKSAGYMITSKVKV